MNKSLSLYWSRIRASARHVAQRGDRVTLGAAALTVVLWASAFAGIRAGLHSYSPESVALLRYLTASICLAVYALLTRMPLPALRDVPGIALTGFLGFSFYNVALNAGEQRIPAGTASLIIASAPVFVALMAGALYGERLRFVSWLGILLSFLGVAVISVKPETGLQISFDAVIILAAAIAQAAYTTFQKPFLKKYSPLQFASYAIWAGTLFLGVFTPRLFAEMQAASTGSTLAVVYMGIFPGAIGYVSWSVVLSRLPASRAGSFLYLVPAVAILIAWAWLGETPGLPAVLGGLLVLAGVILVNARLRSGPARP